MGISKEIAEIQAILGEGYTAVNRDFRDNPTPETLARTVEFGIATRIVEMIYGVRLDVGRPGDPSFNPNLNSIPSETTSQAPH